MGVLQDFLYFSRPQRRAITGLLVLNALLCTAFLFLPLFFAPPPVDFTAFEEEVNRFYAQAATAAHTPFRFDPNTVSAAALDSLEVPAYVGRRIIRFREKGGRFFHPADLRKIYGMNDSLYVRLEPWIHITDTSYSPGSPLRKRRPAYSSAERFSSREARLSGKIQLNTADTLRLRGLERTGPRLASRIVRYRDWLGGFTTFAQLTEVYGIDSLWVKQNTPYFEPLSPVRKINLNTCSYEELSRHPYVSTKLARELIAYRQQREPFTDVADMRFFDLVDEELYRKLAPYLTTE